MKRTASVRTGLHGLAVLAAVLAAGGVAGSAHAYWTSAGEGAGTVSSSSFVPVSIDAVHIGGPLRPNGPGRAVGIVVANPNPFPVAIAYVDVAGVTSDRPGCTGSATGVTVLVAALTGSVLAASGTTALSAVAVMNGASVSTCQGAVFSATLTVEVRT